MLDIEETLSRELHEVAGALHVPAMPALPEESPRTIRHWIPVLAAAAVLVLVLGVVAVVTIDRGGRAPNPAPPSPTPTETAQDEIPTTAPTVPYQYDGRLLVRGEVVEGAWGYLSTGGGTWLAMSAEDGTWWWGTGAEPQQQIETNVDSPPVLSPNGAYVAVLRGDEGGIVTAFDTADGTSLGSAPVDLGNQTDGSAVHIRAVTDDGQVVVQGIESTILWSAFDGSETVDLDETAPGQVFHESTAAGVWVSDGEDGDSYLAEISDAGELTRIAGLPGLDSLAVSQGGESMAWTPRGSVGGDAFYLNSLEVGSVDGTHEETLTAPGMWEFVVGSWLWEDEEHLVSGLFPGEDHVGPMPMVRCSVSTGRCVLIEVP